MDANDGVAYIGESAGSGQSMTVAVETVDDVVGDARIAVMKLDVEGAELGVLSGARRALGDGRITHIVFEDHVGADSSGCARARRQRIPTLLARLVRPWTASRRGSPRASGDGL